MKLLNMYLISVDNLSIISACQMTRRNNY